MLGIVIVDSVIIIVIFIVEMFKDIGKDADRLLEDGYSYVNKLEIKTTNKSNVVIVGEGEIATNGKGVQSSIAASYVGNSFILDKLRVKSDGRILMEAALRTSSISKFTVSAEDGRQEPGKPLQSFGKLGCELLFPKVSLTADIDVINGPLIKTTTLYKYNDNISFGGEAIINSHLEDKGLYPEISNFNIGFTYKGPDWIIGTKTNDLLSTIRVSYLHNMSSNLCAASRLDYSLKSNYQKLTFGGKMVLDEKSSVKAKIDSNALIAASYQQQLSKICKMSVNAEVDAYGWTSDSHKFGINLQFDS